MPLEDSNVEPETVKVSQEGVDDLRQICGITPMMQSLAIEAMFDPTVKMPESERSVPRRIADAMVNGVLRIRWKDSPNSIDDPLPPESTTVDTDTVTVAHRQGKKFALIWDDASQTRELVLDTYHAVQLAHVILEMTEGIKEETIRIGSRTFSAVTMEKNPGECPQCRKHSYCKAYGLCGQCITKIQCPGCCHNESGDVIWSRESLEKLRLLKDGESFEELCIACERKQQDGTLLKDGWKGLVRMPDGKWAWQGEYCSYDSIESPAPSVQTKSPDAG